VAKYLEIAAATSLAYSAEVASATKAGKLRSLAMVDSYPSVLRPVG